MKQLLVLFIVLSSVLAFTACQTTNVSFKSYDLGQGGPVSVSGLYFEPKTKGRRPAVILLHSCGGLSQHVTQDWPEFLTELGYVVLSVDSYTPRSIDRCHQFKGGFAAIHTKQARDAYGALEHLAGLPGVDPSRIAVIGFSAGANAINRWIVNRFLERKGKPTFAAAIAFYGRCHDIPIMLTNTVPTLEIVAEHDTPHRPSCLQAAKYVKELELLDIADAHHAFDSLRMRTLRIGPAGETMLYSAAATRLSEKAVQKFLAKHLGG